MIATMPYIHILVQKELSYMTDPKYKSKTVDYDYSYFHFSISNCNFNYRLLLKMIITIIEDRDYTQLQVIS